MISPKDKKVAYLDNRMKIYEEFHVAVEKAHVLCDSKCKSATTNKAIDEAHDAFKTVFKHATQTRNDALLGLGAVPAKSDYLAGY